MNGIEVEGLRHAFARRPVLRDVAFSVAQGEFVTLLGSSGAGETTLFRCLSGLIRPDAGRILLAGHPIPRLRGSSLAAAWRDIGVVFQQFNLVRRRSALENALAGRLAAIRLWRRLGRFATADRDAALAALDRVGLAAQADQRADLLSGGQQQSVAIARALVQRSRVLLADEPVASLDPMNAEAVMALLKEIAGERAMTVLCSLHQTELAYRFADCVPRMGLLRIRLWPGERRHNSDRAHGSLSTLLSSLLCEVTVAGVVDLLTEWEVAQQHPDGSR